MNKIYKVIWSKAKHCYIVASEIAKSHTKSGSTGGMKKLLLATLAAASLTCGGFVGASAATTETFSVTESGSTNTHTVYTSDSVNNLLAEKANATAVSAWLSNKADAAETTKALNNKADVSLSNVDATGQQRIKDFAKAAVKNDLDSKADTTLSNVTSISETGVSAIKTALGDTYATTASLKTATSKETLVKTLGTDTYADTGLSNITTAGEEKIKKVMEDDMAKKADAANVYTKSEADNKFATYGYVKDYAYTKKETESKISEATKDLAKNDLSNVKSISTEAEGVIKTALEDDFASASDFSELKKTVGDNDSGLVQKVNDLETSKIDEDKAKTIVNNAIYGGDDTTAQPGSLAEKIAQNTAAAKKANDAIENSETGLAAAHTKAEAAKKAADEAQKDVAGVKETLYGEGGTAAVPNGGLVQDMSDAQEAIRTLQNNVGAPADAATGTESTGLFKSVEDLQAADKEQDKRIAAVEDKTTKIKYNTNTDTTKVNSNFKVTGESTFKDKATFKDDVQIDGDITDKEGNTTSVESIVETQENTSQITYNKNTDTTKVDSNFKVTGESTFKDKATFKNGIEVTGGVKTDNLEVSGNITDGKGHQTSVEELVTTRDNTAGITRKDEVTTIEGNVSIDTDGNINAEGTVTAGGFAVDGTAIKIDSEGINAGSKKITNVAAGEIAEDSTDAVNGGQLFTEQQARIDADAKLDKKIGRVWADGNYIKEGTDGTNDGASVSDNLRNLDNALGKVKENGYVITATEEDGSNTTISKNLENLDAGLQKTDESIGKQFEDGNYIKASTNAGGASSVYDNLRNLDNALKPVDDRTQGLERTTDDKGNATTTVKDNLVVEKDLTVKGDTNLNGELHVEAQDGDKKTNFDVTADGVSQVITDGKNTSKTINTATQTKQSMTDEAGNTTSTKQTSEAITTYAKDADGNTTSTKQDGSMIKTYAKDSEGNVTTTIQTGKDIENKAEKGTISNTAKDLINKATEKILNQVVDEDGNPVASTEMDNKGNITTNADGAVTTTSKDSVTTQVVDENGDPVASTVMNKTGITDTVTDDNGNTNTGTQTATNTISTVTDANGNKTSTNQSSEAIKTYAKDADGNKSYTTQEGNRIASSVIDSDGKTAAKTEMDAEGNITNKATETITNDAKNLINKATEKILNEAKDIENVASNSVTTKVVGEDGEPVASTEMDAEGNITNTATNSITSNVGNTSIQQRVNDIVMGYADKSTIQINEESVDTTSKVINNKASEVINNEAININNTASGVITSKANEIKNTADKLISNKVGENTEQEITDGRIRENIKDGSKQLISNKTADGVDTSVTDGVNTSIQNQHSSYISSIVKDTDGNENVSNSSSTQTASQIKDKSGNINNSTSNAGMTMNTITDGTNANSVTSTAKGTTFTNTASVTSDTINGTEQAVTTTETTIKGNTISTGTITADTAKMGWAEVMNDLGVRGNATVDKTLTVKGESKLEGNTTIGTAEKNADLKVYGNSEITGNQKVGGTLEVTGDATFHNNVEAKSYTVAGTKIKLDDGGLYMDDRKITGVADGDLSAGSKDVVNGGQLYKVREDLNDRVDRVGANAAAMANLRPMDFDGDSKWSVSGAIGNYGSETAAAIGAFFRPNEDVSFNVSTTLGTGENMVGGGVSVRLGKGGHKMSKAEQDALKAQVNALTARMDALLSVLNPNMSQEFPDVPENHWAYEAVSRLAGNGIVEGYPDGEFHGDRTMSRYEMAEIIYNALSQGMQAEKDLVEEFKPELQAMAASKQVSASSAAPAAEAPAAESPAAEAPVAEAPAAAE